MAAKRNRRPNSLRLILQWGIMVLLAYMLLRPIFDRSYMADFEAYCPFGGMQALGSFFNSNTLTCSMTTVQISMGLALFLAVLILSKLFCSYICPLGTLTEWLGQRARKLKLQITLKGAADKYLRVLKYALLFVTFYYSITSSELFCRKFDPFYASLTGFSGDVVWYFALPALLLTVVGSFFIRQFWCKYLCPLGAITNIAVYALPAVTLSLLWVLLNQALSLDISWVWLLGALCLMGFILEATTLRFLIFPPLRISRNEEICTNCKICDKKCPMALEISTVKTVNHIDCHLCVDCVAKCPEKGALTINKRSMKWLPAVAVIVLIAAALFFSSSYELPTISERWTTTEQLKKAEVFEMSGLKNIKCFGSSRAFANQMKEVKGVLGVETYVKHHKVRVYYDASLTNPELLKAAIFRPFASYLAVPSVSVGVIQTVSLGIDRCFDPKDQSLLIDVLSLQKGILAVETSFGEPIHARIFYDTTLISPKTIEASIEQKKVIFGEGDDKVEVELDFMVNRKDLKYSSLPKEEFLTEFLEPQDVSFNKYDNYKESELKTIMLPSQEIISPEMQEWIPYLISHLSNDDGVVRFQMVLSGMEPGIKIWYVPSITDTEKINKLLKAPEFLVHYPDKSVKKFENPFKF